MPGTLTYGPSVGKPVVNYDPQNPNTWYMSAYNPSSPDYVGTEAQWNASQASQAQAPAPGGQVSSQSTATASTGLSPGQVKAGGAYVPYDPGPIDYYGGYDGGAASMAGHGLAGMVDARSRANAAFDAMLAAGPAVAQASTAQAAQGDIYQGDTYQGDIYQGTASLGDAYFGDLNQATENEELSNREFASRQGDQAGSIQLLREGAMGLAPSEAQYMLQRGLDSSLAAQQAQMGSARGQGALALAGGNAMANSAAMQNQAYLQAAQLRAKEMQDYTNAYSNAANQMRAQDQQRLGLGNQMNIQNAQFANDMSLANARQAQDASFQNAGLLTNTSNQNAALSTNASYNNAALATNASLQNAGIATNGSMQNAQMMTNTNLANAAQANQVALGNAQNTNSYNLGIGSVGAQYGNTGLGYLNAANDPYKAALAAMQNDKVIRSNNYNAALAANSGVATTGMQTQSAQTIASNQASAERDAATLRAGGQLLNTAAEMGKSAFSTPAVGGSVTSPGSYSQGGGVSGGLPVAGAATRQFNNIQQGQAGIGGTNPQYGYGGGGTGRPYP